MKDKAVQNILSLLSAYILNSSVFVALISPYTSESLQTLLVGGVIKITTIIAFATIIIRSDKLKIFFKIACVLFALYLYQMIIDNDGSGAEFYNKFLLHGLGGACIALSITEFKTLGKFLSLFSTILLLILVFEPMNNALLQKDEMTTGYLMTSLVIYLIFSYYLISHSKFILVLAIYSSVTVLIFTSRGCGVSIGLTWVAFYIWQKKKDGHFSVRSIILLITSISVIFVLLLLFINYLYESGVEFQKGSLIEKITSGYANESNGREDIWNNALTLASNSFWGGIGMGKDRLLGDYVFIHNIILELFLNFGFPIMLIILMLYWNTIVKCLKNKPYSILSALVISMTIRYWVQLMFSSSYLESMYGLMFIIGIAYQQKNRLNNCKKHNHISRYVDSRIQQEVQSGLNT